MFSIKIAGLTIRIDNRFEFVEHLAKDYVTDGVPDFTVHASDDEIQKEGQNSEADFTDGYLESIVVYRKIAERLPEYDAFVFHGAVLNFDGTAYAFTAKSGVGKTTHTELWLNRFAGRVRYLNGDKPVIRFINGTPFACGTPWRGKENYGVNERAPLKGIAFLSRDEENSAETVPADAVATRLMSQIYLPRDPTMLVKTMRLADRLIKSVRLVDLRCNMDISAADVSYSALCGKKD